MSVELHLPDLPEVPISIGAVRTPTQRTRIARHLRMRDALSAYLPLLLMTLLALATWWLVKNSPGAPAPLEERPLSMEPDYTMQRFTLERFDPTGRLRLRIEGAQMRHIPATDRIEIDEPQIRSIAPDGRVTLAHARRALGTGDGSEVQLIGDAEVRSVDLQGTPLVVRSEFLDAFLVTERLLTHVPVQVQNGATTMRAAGLEYDHPSGRLDLKGPLRVVMPPRTR